MSFQIVGKTHNYLRNGSLGTNRSRKWILANWDAALGITKGGGDVVTAWVDQTRHARSMAEATNGPVWTASEVNGLPGLVFDGTNDLLLSAFALPQPFTVYLVMKIASTPTVTARLWTGNGGDGTCIAYWNSGNIVMYAGATGTGIPFTVDGNYKLVGAVYNGADSGGFVNDGSFVSNGVGAQPAGGFRLAGDGLNPFCPMSVAAVMICDGFHNAGTREKIKDIFNTKFNLWT
jgi:hypothetical protein